MGCFWKTFIPESWKIRIFEELCFVTFCSTDAAGKDRDETFGSSWLKNIKDIIFSFKEIKCIFFWAFLATLRLRKKINIENSWHKKLIVYILKFDFILQSFKPWKVEIVMTKSGDNSYLFLLPIFLLHKL